MRVFITGASGHIASAVIPELTANGHQVVGLVRSDASAATVQALGAQVRRGDLDDLEGLKAASAEADGVIHLGFKHELMRSGRFEDAIASDLAAINAIADGLDGSGKPLISTGGSLMLAFADLGGRVGTEDDLVAGGPRVDAENAVAAFSQRGIRSAIIRLSPLVHSDLDHHGFTPSLISLARKNGFAAYVGEGTNRWPAAHTRDIGLLYHLALEQAPAGSRLHGVADEGVAFRVIAEAIASNLGLEAVSITPEQAPEYLSFLADFAQIDNPTSSAKTRELLGWQPTHAGLIDDINSGHYFSPVTVS